MIGHALKRNGERALVRLVYRYPKVANYVTCLNLGRLTANDERLHKREVPTITVQKLLRAMELDR